VATDVRVYNCAVFTTLNAPVATYVLVDNCAKYRKEAHRAPEPLPGM
jgi:hypothetical protein